MSGAAAPFEHCSQNGAEGKVIGELRPEGKRVDFRKEQADHLYAMKFAPRTPNLRATFSLLVPRKLSKYSQTPHKQIVWRPPSVIPRRPVSQIRMRGRTHSARRVCFPEACQVGTSLRSTSRQ